MILVFPLSWFLFFKLRRGSGYAHVEGFDLIILALMKWEVGEELLEQHPVFYFFIILKVAPLTLTWVLYLLTCVTLALGQWCNCVGSSGFRKCDRGGKKPQNTPISHSDDARIPVNHTWEGFSTFLCRWTFSGKPPVGRFSAALGGGLSCCSVPKQHPGTDPKPGVWPRDHGAAADRCVSQ